MRHEAAGQGDFWSDLDARSREDLLKTVRGVLTQASLLREAGQTVADTIGTTGFYVKRDAPLWPLWIALQQLHRALDVESARHWLARTYAIEGLVVLAVQLYMSEGTSQKNQRTIRDNFASTYIAFEKQYGPLTTPGGGMKLRVKFDASITRPRAPSAGRPRRGDI